MNNETTTTNDAPQEGRNNRRTLLINGGKLGCRPSLVSMLVNSFLRSENIIESSVSRQSNKDEGYDRARWFAGHGVSDCADQARKRCDQVDVPGFHGCDL